MKLSKNFTNPLAANNPVIVQILGICSALAVTVKLEPALVMGISVTFVTAFSNESSTYNLIVLFAIAFSEVSDTSSSILIVPCSVYSLY